MYNKAIMKKTYPIPATKFHGVESDKLMIPFYYKIGQIFTKPVATYDIMCPQGAQP
jgi:hypothetical protein